MHKVSFNFEKTDVLKYFEDCMYEIDIELESPISRLSFITT